MILFLLPVLGVNGIGMAKDFAAKTCLGLFRYLLHSCLGFRRRLTLKSFLLRHFSRISKLLLGRILVLLERAARSNRKSSFRPQDICSYWGLDFFRRGPFSQAAFPS